MLDHAEGAVRQSDSNILSSNDAESAQVGMPPRSRETVNTMGADGR